MVFLIVISISRTTRLLHSHYFAVIFISFLDLWKVQGRMKFCLPACLPAGLQMYGWSVHFSIHTSIRLSVRLLVRKSIGRFVGWSFGQCASFLCKPHLLQNYCLVLTKFAQNQSTCRISNISWIKWRIMIFYWKTIFLHADIKERKKLWLTFDKYDQVCSSASLFIAW